eukprot:scaffold4206_cov196-Alexandrium_tamarense.AAC.24
MTTEHPPQAPNPRGTSKDGNAAASGGDRRPNKRRGNRGGRGGGAAGRGDGETNNTDAAADATSNNRRRRGGGRGRGGRGGHQVAPNIEAPSSPRSEMAIEFISDCIDANDGAADTTATDTKNNRPSTNPNRQRQKKPKPNLTNNNTTIATNEGDAANTNDTKKKKSPRKKKPKQKKSYPWTQYLPPDAVDPISLDPLDELSYPPFALVVDEPFVAIMPGMWPPPSAKDVDSTTKNATDGKSNDGLTTQDRELLILREQWGEGLAETANKTANGKQPATASSVVAAPTNSTATSPADVQGRIFNLFDGRVLAYYLVSTLQFIDPLNRRDLTRPELVALDAYLSQHKLGNAGVVEAYDDKGVTVSSAGIAGQTAGGRAEILQQEARAILGSFFRGGAAADGQQQQNNQQPQSSRRQRRQNGERVTRGGGDDVTNSFQRMYLSDEQRSRANQRTNRAHEVSNQQEYHDSGIYAGDYGGFIMIDDDINPGLRSGIPTTNNNRTGTLYSARHIAEHHSQEAQVREGNFPSLPSTSADQNVTAPPKKPPAPGGPSKSLKKITKVVKKTTPAELAKQKKAREEALRKAEMSRLNYFDPDNLQPGNQMQSGLMTAPVAVTKLPPSEVVLERNKNLAMALGVAPATLRNQIQLTGWKRPTSTVVDYDEFGNELNATQYPDELLLKARDRMTELLKLEKIWKKFLADDRDASCSLKPMDRPTRVFVHEYSDFWRLTTQSYDPEGRRYIHCVKTVDTSTPHPLLSEAVRKWRGPAPAGIVALPTIPAAIAPTAPTTAPQPSADGWHNEQRVPLKLAPRTVAEGSELPLPSSGGLTRSTSTPLLSMTGEKPPPPRFAGLQEAERPKLELAPRTVPTTQDYNKYAAKAEEEARRKRNEEARLQRQEERAKKELAKAQKQQAILSSAFASDDEDAQSSGSDWFEDEAAFEGSDDEGL